MLIGIPQSLYYYHFYPFWQSLFQSLGHEIILSPPTDNAVLERGLVLTPDEYCLPVKIHRGHVDYLEDRCDRIFSPGFGRHGRRGHFCPKLTGLPDVIRAKHVKTITFWHDLDGEDRMDPAAWRRTMLELNPHLSESDFMEAWKAAWEVQSVFVQSWSQTGSPANSLRSRANQAPKPVKHHKPEYCIAVVGHPYIVYDPWMTRRLYETLQRYGVEIRFQESAPRDEISKRWEYQSKKVYWPVGQEILSAAQYFSRSKEVDGIIQLSSCLCGPDAIIGELLAKYIRHDGEVHLPFLQLTLDEHSGWAGLQTRVEAFMDLLNWRNRHAQV